MTLGISTTTRNAILQAIADAIDAGPAGGTIKFYDGTRPATGGTATTLLATLTFSASCALSVAAGLLTFNTITADTSIDANGTATWARIADSTGTFVYDCSVGTSGADINLNTNVLAIAAELQISSATITAPNA